MAVELELSPKTKRPVGEPLLRAGGAAEMDEVTRADMEQWTGCIAGALTREEFEKVLTAAGLKDVEIRETHAVHEFAASAIVRARKPRRDAG